MILVEDKPERLPARSGSDECCSSGCPSCNDAKHEGTLNLTFLERSLERVVILTLCEKHMSKLPTLVEKQFLFFRDKLGVRENNFLGKREC